MYISYDPGVRPQTAFYIDFRLFSLIFKNLGGTPGGTQRHPSGTQETPRAPRRPEAALEAKCAKTIMFFSAKVARPSVSRKRQRPDPHRLRYILSKVDSRKPENLR